ncbi:MAG: alpha/beta hydrolase [Myxococcota bacterium]
MKLAIQLAERVAPRWVEDEAFARWGRPQRRPTRWNGVAPGRVHHLEVGDVALAAWEWSGGPDARKTALLVHGWSGNAAQMSSFVEPLRAAGFHVVAVDLPAHGETAGDFATILSMAEALASLGRRLRPEVVVAHSLGATATTYALTRGLRPERVVLLAPPVALPPYLQQFTDAVGLSAEMRERLLGRVEQLLRRPIDELDLRTHAPRLAHVEALVVHDAGDRVVPVATSRELVAGWPGARLVETTGLSHDAIRRDARVVEEALAFLRDERREAAPSLQLAPT